MSLQEQKKILLTVLSVVTTVVYGWIVYNGYQDGRYFFEDLYQFYARVILIFIPITIVVHIIGMILFAIGQAIATEIKGEEQEDIDLVDERDQKIELQTTRVSMVIFMLAFVGSLAYLALGFTAHHFFLTLIAGGILSELGETGYTIYLYRRGA